MIQCLHNPHKACFDQILAQASQIDVTFHQGIFEGLKAYRTEDGRIVLFRPEENAQRMKIGADRLCMPSPSIDQFVDAVKQTALANKRWVLISSCLSISKFNLYTLSV